MKKAIIIGGTSGIGHGIAEQLLKKDYHVFITGMERDFIKDVQQGHINGLEAYYLDCIQENASEVLPKLVEKLGGLDLLVNSAGIGNLNKNLGHKVENQANQLNVLAFTEIMDWGYRFFEKQGYGNLVGITSIAGLFGSRVAPAYHAAKSYQITYLQSLKNKAKKSGLPIYITDIRPGFVKTPMTEGKKMFWVANKETAAKQIVALVEKRKSFGYISKRWVLIASLIKIIPTWLRVYL